MMQLRSGMRVGPAAIRTFNGDMLDLDPHAQFFRLR
jgi:hypothetical protein